MKCLVKHHLFKAMFLTESVFFFVGVFWVILFDYLFKQVIILSCLGLSFKKSFKNLSLLLDELLWAVCILRLQFQSSFFSTVWCGDSWGQPESVMWSLCTCDDDRLGRKHTDELWEHATEQVVRGQVGWIWQTIHS